jgi:hypothetical protein
VDARVSGCSTHPFPEGENPVSVGVPQEVTPTPLSVVELDSGEISHARSNKYVPELIPTPLPVQLSPRKKIVISRGTVPQVKIRSDGGETCNFRF